MKVFWRLYFEKHYSRKITPDAKCDEQQGQVGCARRGWAPLCSWACSSRVCGEIAFPRQKASQAYGCLFLLQCPFIASLNWRFIFDVLWKHLLGFTQKLSFQTWVFRRTRMGRKSEWLLEVTLEAKSLHSPIQFYLGILCEGAKLKASVLS